MTKDSTFFGQQLARALQAAKREGHELARYKRSCGKRRKYSQTAAARLKGKASWVPEIYQCQTCGACHVNWRQQH